MKRTKQIVINDWSPNDGSYTLEEFKQWWPDFEQFKKVYFKPENCPLPFTKTYSWEPGKIFTYQVTGRWGMFSQHYNTGHGRLLIGEIVDEIKVEIKE